MSTDQTPEELNEINQALMSDENRPQVLMDNEGGMYINSRAARRKKPVTDRKHTKSTHKDKKLRSKNVKRSENRKRAAARARKNSQENNSQIS